MEIIPDNWQKDLKNRFVLDRVDIFQIHVFARVSLPVPGSGKGLRVSRTNIPTKIEEKQPRLTVPHRIHRFKYYIVKIKKYIK